MQGNKYLGEPEQRDPTPTLTGSVNYTYRRIPYLDYIMMSNLGNLNRYTYVEKKMIFTSPTSELLFFYALRAAILQLHARTSHMHRHYVDHSSYSIRKLLTS